MAMQTIELNLVSLTCLELYSSAAPHVSLRNLCLHSDPPAALSVEPDEREIPPTGVAVDGECSCFHALPTADILQMPPFERLTNLAGELPNAATRLSDGAHIEMPTSMPSMHDARYTGVEKSITLRIMTPHRREIDIRLSESRLVEDLIVAANLLGRNLHAYYEGRKMRVGRRLSEYNLPDGARIEMRTSPQRL
jgi:hypothetical protein